MGSNKDERLAVLGHFTKHNVSFPFDLVAPLLSFDLSFDEKMALLESGVIGDPDAYETFIFGRMNSWGQDLAAGALRLWADRTGHKQWQELMRILSWPGIPQRILYTILDVSDRISQPEVVRASVDVAVSGMIRGERWSEALLGLLYLRMAQFSISNDEVLARARLTCRESVRDLIPAEKSVLPAWVLVRKFDKDLFDSLRAEVVAGSTLSMVGFLPDTKNFNWPVINHSEIRSSANQVNSSRASGITPELIELFACLEKLPVMTRSGLNVSARNTGSPGKPSSGNNSLLKFWSIIQAEDSGPSWDSAVNQTRKLSGIYRLALIRALGSCRGADRAVLKLLDFVRSDEIAELHEIARALVSIGTPRAIQELISMFSRHNACTDLQMEIINQLRHLDLAGHLDALRGIRSHVQAQIADLQSKGQLADAAVEAHELITALIDAATDNRGGEFSVEVRGGVHGNSEVGGPALDAGVMDHGLREVIPHYSSLSSEVKRALRTAWYFHQHVNVSGIEGATAAIDLSPVIDMQYKALELLFREYFEGACSQLIREGVIQRRLDLIGYSRPVPEKMEEFESFIAGLPVIREIPFFSKFKLRKMLLALCQFRPGKRFTLDGLKAFGLFFMAFGRSDCRFGLAGILPIIPGAFRSDSELAEFCRLLHVFQDFRNRAAHEGFHPDVAADMDSIWRNTAEIVQVARDILGVFDGKAHERRLVRERAS